MKRTQIVQLGAAAFAGTLLLAACGGSSSGGGDSSESAAPGGAAYAGPVGDGEGQVNVLAWPGYVEDGSTDPAVDWVTGFEEETGCQVNVKTFGTSDEAVKLMQGGGWDVVSASGDATLRLIYGENVQPMNTALVPNYVDIFPELKDKSWNSVGGQMYGAPHGRGANLLMYNTEVVSPAPDSWAITWEADSPYAGKITGYDSPIFIADAALYLKSAKPELGITDPYALDQTQFQAAIDLLTQQKELIGEYWSDYLKEIAAFKGGSIVAGTTWQVIANVAQGEEVPVEVVKPKEGSTGWSDTWMIAKDTANINCSYKFVNHIVSPEANAKIAEWFGEAPANMKACALTANKDHCAIFHAEETDYWTDVYYWNTPTAKCLDGRTDVQCIPYSEWVTAWAALRSS